MIIRLNNQEREVTAASLGELLREMDTRPEMVTVEHNGVILERDEIETTALGEGDNLTVLHFMGGGGEFSGE